VDPSPWPIFTAFSAMVMLMGTVQYMHLFIFGGYITILGFISVTSVTYFWWSDVIREGTLQGHHTKAVEVGIKIGMVLFIISEIMFFFSFFWSFFTSSIAPTNEIPDSKWPPLGIEVLNAFEIPLLNTALLLLSGATITWSHYALIGRDRFDFIASLSLTVCLGVMFTTLQLFEYIDAPFNINDGIYGSTFFLATGFHGFHVLVGTVFLSVCLYRGIKYHFTDKHHIGFEAAVWYWHSVCMYINNSIINLLNNIKVT
jgi:heme/copper-type cytochrome/quinol oxidase subunit 3